MWKQLNRACSERGLNQRQVFCFIHPRGWVTWNKVWNATVCWRTQEVSTRWRSVLFLSSLATPTSAGSSLCSPLVLLEHKAESPNSLPGRLLPLQEAKRRGGEAAAMQPLDSRKIHPVWAPGWHHTCSLHTGHFCTRKNRRPYHRRETSSNCIYF